jgi:autotransporter-associated beta strand protein
VETATGLSLRRLGYRIALAIAVLGVPLLAGAPARAQITYNVTYSDGNIGPGGIGFADPTVDPGETLSRGQLRRNSITAALNYLGTVLDGRGTVHITVNPSLTGGTGPLGQFGPNAFVGINGSFQNGQGYQAARTNAQPFGAPDITGQFDFGYSYNYSGQNNAPSNSSFDMTSIAAHELTHGHGFLNLVKQSGQGLFNQTAGNPDVYGVFDKYLQRGNGGGATPLLNTNIANSNYGSFANTSLTSTFTNQNDPSIGLFFGGPYAKEVFGGPVPLYAPTTFQPGSSIGHDNTTSPIGLMNPNITPNTVRRLQPYEIAMLLDIGWNVYNWNNTTGNWLDGVSNLANSRWRTDLGIDYDGTNTFNTNATPSQAPILPVYGQVTSNIVLNFGGSGSTAYTSTNNIGTVRLARLNLNSTSSATNTITGGTLLFGQNSDLTSSVLVPKIVQQNTGAFNIGSTLQIPVGLTVDGTGSGRVTISGQITGAGALTKAGPFALALSNGTNNYAGGTTVSAGTLLVSNTSGSATGAGAVTVSGSGAQLAGTGRITGTVGVSGSATLAPGDPASNLPGILTFSGAVTLDSTATFRAQLNGSTAGNTISNYARMVIESGGSLNLGSATLQALLGNGFTPNSSTVLAIIDNQNPTGGLSGTFSGLAADGSTVSIGGFTASIFYHGDTSTLATSGGNDVLLSFSPVPEPAGLLAVAFAAVGGLTWLRNGRRRRAALAEG